MKKHEIFQISHGVNPEKFRKDLGSDPQNSRQILTNYGRKPMIFWNFACFGEILSLSQKPNRTNPENSGNTDGPIRKVPDRVWRKLKTLAEIWRSARSHVTECAKVCTGFTSLCEDTIRFRIRTCPPLVPHGRNILFQHLLEALDSKTNV
jgi:hypothetical protein